MCLHFNAGLAVCQELFFRKCENNVALAKRICYKKNKRRANMQVDAQKIKQFRELHGFKFADIAVATDRSERWVQEVEKGKLVNINRHIAAALAKKLGCKLEEIARG
jgi:DNA-binding XRE family transcriptional regulator